MASFPAGEALPLQPGVAAVAEQLETDPARLAATRGDDYELCVCLPPAVRATGGPSGWRGDWGALTWVGQVHAGAAGVHFAGDEPELRGYEHLI